MENKPINVLISAYACGPNWGSEIGMGWNWVVSISNYCKLTVITESNFKEDIEEKLPDLNLKYQPDFYYLDIGERGRKLFWKQGSASFYSHYKKWQEKVFFLAQELVLTKKIDIIHQLNMIGYREPGYLWKIQNIPYIIGPLGGYNQYPYRFFSALNFRDKGFYLARNVINWFQMQFLSRPKKAYKRADYVILAMSSGKELVSRYTVRKPIIISETGAHKYEESLRSKNNNGKLILTWVGVISGRKTLSIAIKSIANSVHRDKLILNVIGEGPDEKRCRKLAHDLGLENIIWYGKIPNIKARKIIAESDLLFFTSVLDATSTVVFEALQSGTPVLCHDTCGFGNVINNLCGIKIPVVSPSASIKLFSRHIDNLVENPERLETLSIGCWERIKDYYWSEKGKKMIKIYEKCLK